MSRIEIILLLVLSLNVIRRCQPVGCSKLTFHCRSQGQEIDEKCETVMISINTTFNDCLDAFRYRWPEIASKKQGASNFGALPSFFPVTSNRTGLNITINSEPGRKAILLWFNISTTSLSLCKAVLFDDEIVNRLVDMWACSFFQDNESDSEFTVRIMNFPQFSKWRVVSRVKQHKYYEPNNVSDWSAPVFLIAPNAKGDTLKTCFQQVPTRLGTFNYTVMLNSHDSIVEESIVLGTQYESETSNILCKTYYNLKSDNYTASVKLADPICSRIKCKESTSPSINISHSSEDFPLVFIVVPCVILFLIVIICCFFCMKQDLKHDSMKVVLLYSYDNKIHNDTVQSLAKLLKHNGVEVIIDTKSGYSEDPGEWLKRNIERDDTLIIMVMSAGAIYKVKHRQKNGILLEEEPAHLTSHLFHITYNEVMRKIRIKKYDRCLFLSVIWNEERKKEVKKMFPDLKHYVLPNEWNKFLHHVRHVRSWDRHLWMRLRSWYNRLTYSSGTAYPQHKEFLKQCKRMNAEGDYINLIQQRPLAIEDIASAERTKVADNLEETPRLKDLSLVAKIQGVKDLGAVVEMQEVEDSSVDVEAQEFEDYSVGAKTPEFEDLGIGAETQDFEGLGAGAETQDFVYHRADAKARLFEALGVGAKTQEVKDFSVGAEMQKVNDLSLGPKSQEDDEFDINGKIPDEYLFTTPQWNEDPFRTRRDIPVRKLNRLSYCGEFDFADWKPKNFRNDVPDGVVEGKPETYRPNDPLESYEGDHFPSLALGNTNIWGPISNVQGPISNVQPSTQESGYFSNMDEMMQMYPKPLVNEDALSLLDSDEDAASLDSFEHDAQVPIGDAERRKILMARIRFNNT